MHTDDQDVILLQVWGSKQWTVYNSPTHLPYTEDHMERKVGVDRFHVIIPIRGFDAPALPIKHVEKTVKSVKSVYVLEKFIQRYMKASRPSSNFSVLGYAWIYSSIFLGDAWQRTSSP